MVHLSFTLSVTGIYRLRFFCRKDWGGRVYWLLEAIHWCTRTRMTHQPQVCWMAQCIGWQSTYVNKKYVPCIKWNTLPTWPHYSTLNTIFARSDAVATIYFVHQFCAASIWEQQLFKSGFYFIQPILSLTYSRRERISIGWLLDRQENLLLQLLLLHCFGAASLVVFACACATQVFVMHAHCGYYSRAATKLEWRLIERVR